MRTAPKFLLICALLGSAACRASQPPLNSYDYTRADQIVQAMRDRYLDRWPSNLTTVMVTTTGDQQTAHLVAYEFPSLARVDLVPREGGNGYTLHGDTATLVRSGAAQGIEMRHDPILIMTDAYFLSVEQTMTRLRAAGVNTALVSERTLENRRVLVIGSDASESAAPQVWIDREHLIPVRTIGFGNAVDAQPADVRWLRYQSLGRGWVPRELHVRRGGVDSRIELTEVRVDIPLDSTLFLPSEWARARHWHQQPFVRPGR